MKEIIKCKVYWNSRYHQLLRLYPSNDMPNLADHDFPVPGYLLKVSGYMILGNSSNGTNKINENLKHSSIYDRKGNRHRDAKS